MKGAAAELQTSLKNNSITVDMYKIVISSLQLIYVHAF